MAKPVVDGIARELHGRAEVLHVDVGSSLGGQLAGRHGVRGVPTLVVYDGQGGVVLRQVGRLERRAVVDTVERLLAD